MNTRVNNAKETVSGFDFMGVREKIGFHKNQPKSSPNQLFSVAVHSVISSGFTNQIIHDDVEQQERA